MKNKALRLVLVLVAIVSFAAAGYFSYVTRQLNESSRDALAGFEADAGKVNGLLGDVLAGLPAYVSPGQGLGYWSERTEGLLQSLSAAVKGLERPETVAAASQEIGALEESVVMMGQYNGRVRLLLESERTSDAAHLIFSDAGQLAATARGALAKAVAVQGQSMRTEIARRDRLATYALAAAVLLSIAVLFLLLSAPAAEHDRKAPHPAVQHSAELDLDIRPGDDAASPARPGGPSVVGLPREAGPVSGESVIVPSAVAPAVLPERSLADAARLCTDLAQVSDTSQLRHLLGGAADLLDATGIVIWLGGVNGSRLQPAFSHGYQPQALARMQAIERDDPNAVSAAYRTAALQVVEAGEEGTSAIVMPLLAPSGCVGAMAVEVRRGAEMDPNLHALGQLVAAQVATLMPTESNA
jgi:hypothetical protein